MTLPTLTWRGQISCEVHWIPYGQSADCWPPSAYRHQRWCGHWTRWNIILSFDVCFVNMFHLLKQHHAFRNMLLAGRWYLIGILLVSYWYLIGFLLAFYWYIIGILLVCYWYIIGILCPNAHGNKIHASVAFDCNVVLVSKFTFTVWQVRGALWLRSPFLGFWILSADFWQGSLFGEAVCLQACNYTGRNKHIHVSVRIEIQITALSRATTGLPFVGAACFVFDLAFNICPEPSSTDWGFPWCF